MRNVVVNGERGKTFGRRAVNGVPQVFVLFDANEGDVNESGMWVEDVPTLYV